MFASAACTAADIPSALHWAAGQPAKIAPSLWEFGPHLIHGSLGPRESAPKQASPLVQPFFSRYMNVTNTWTDHTTLSVAVV